MGAKSTPLTILRYPDERLREVSLPVDLEEIITPSFQGFVDDMLSTMYSAGGVGLAAPQVAVHKRVVVVDISTGRNEPQVFINPNIVQGWGDSAYMEGCLSIPGLTEFVRRSAEVEVHYFDRLGNPQQIIARQLLATCIQHEVDHLNGKLYIDRVSTLRRRSMLRELKKILPPDTVLP